MDERLYSHGSQLSALTTEVSYLRGDIGELREKQDELLTAIHDIQLNMVNRKRPIMFGAGSGAAVVALVEALRAFAGQ